MKKKENVKQAVEERERETKKTLIMIVFITILVLSVLGLSFATIRVNKQKETINSITTSNISMSYTEDVNGISITNALPIADSVGKLLNGKGEYFDFTINTSLANNAKVNYEISVEKDKASTLADSDIKLYLEKQESGSYESLVDPVMFKPITQESELGTPEGSMILKTVTKENSGSDNYRLRMWIKEDAVVPQNSQIYTVRVNVYAKALAK